MSMEDRLKAYVFALASVLGALGKLEARLQRTHGTADRGQLGLNTIIAGFSLVVVGAALVYALDIFDSSIGSPDNSQLSSAQGSMFDGFASLASFVEIILVIAAVVVLIGLIRRVQG